MNKKIFPFLSLLFFMFSCYIYKPYTEKEVIEQTQNKSGSLTPQSIRELNAGGSARTGGKVDQAGRREGDGDMARQQKEEEIKRKKEEMEEIRAQKEQMEKSGGDTKAFGKSPNANANNPNQNQNLNQKNTNVNADAMADLSSLKRKIQPNKYYRITVAEKQYKIQTVKWEGDTLVSHIIRKPKKELKFHENQIDEEALEERRFSKPYSDMMTVGAYVAGGVAVLLLVL